MDVSLDLDAIERRITELENIVFGNSDKDLLYPKAKQSDIQCIDTLLELQEKIIAAVCCKKRLLEVLDNLPALTRYLNPGYADEITLSTAAKEDIILAEEDHLRWMASQFQVMEENRGVVGSEYVKYVPKLADRLQSLSAIHTQQQDDTALIAGETAQLIDKYNSVISNLSRLFVSWNAEVTKLEMTVNG